MALVNGSDRRSGRENRFSDRKLRPDPTENSEVSGTWRAAVIIPYCRLAARKSSFGVGCSPAAWLAPSGAAIAAPGRLQPQKQSAKDRRTATQADQEGRGLPERGPPTDLIDSKRPACCSRSLVLLGLLGGGRRSLGALFWGWSRRWRRNGCPDGASQAAGEQPPKAALTGRKPSIGNNHGGPPCSAHFQSSLWGQVAFSVGNRFFTPDLRSEPLTSAILRNQSAKSAHQIIW